MDDWVGRELSRIFLEICDEKGFELMCHNILIDHVHLLIVKQAMDSNEYVMKMIKGISSRRFFQKFPSNRFQYRKLWGRGYRAEEIKDREHYLTVVDYISFQDSGILRMNFADSKGTFLEAETFSLRLPM